MAKVDFNVLGNVKNKVGNVVGYQWKGIGVLRGYKAWISNPKSEAQRLQRAKFSLMAKLAKACRPILLAGMKANANSTKSTIYGQFVKFNLDMVSGNLDSLTIDYSGLEFSRGGLLMASLGTPSFVTPGSVSVQTSETHTGEADAQADDILYLALVCPDVNGGVVSGGVNRGSVDDNPVLQCRVPASWQGMRAYAYAFAVKADGSATSDTVSLGYGDIS